MANFIIEEFDHYKVFLYSQKNTGAGSDCAIQFTIPSGKVVLNFLDDPGYKNLVEERDGKLIFDVFLKTNQYSAHIDILRYEKPLFFFYNLDNNEAYITTSDEPVGEEEHSSD